MSANQNVNGGAAGGEEDIVLNDQYHLIREIGSGSYGCVYLATDVTAKRYIVKLEKEKEQQRKSAEVEFSSLSVFKHHKGVVTLIAKLEIDGLICLENIMLGSNLNATIQFKVIDFGVAKYFRKPFELTKKDNMYCNCHYASGRMSAGLAATPREDIVMLLMSLMKAQMKVLPFDRRNYAVSRADRMMFEQRYKDDHYHLPSNLYHLARIIFKGEVTFYPDYNAIKAYFEGQYRIFKPSTDKLRFDFQKNGTIIIS
uniref:Protein kinase domain-containing protein n=1 Tax=Caenorhabditis tropicalis TaxID=1561998 RepID=A0A1I7UPQ1_9PELO